MSQETRCEACDKCGPFEACGFHHVYVIELSKDVLNKPRFCRDRSNLRADAQCFYVGQTKHRVECRYKQHVANRAARARTGFMCSCKDGQAELVPFGPFNHGNSFVQEYHLPGGLRPGLFADKNPIKGGNELAKIAERELAESLLREGHAVHFA